FLKFQELFFDAIKIRMPPELSIGSYLSGGLDSTAIVCLTQNLLSKTKNTLPQTLISAIYSEKQSNEQPFIEDVARFTNEKVNYVYPSTIKSWDDIKKFVYHLDEPVTVLNYYAYWCLARTTVGLAKVTFSGQGADEYLAGHVDHSFTYLRELWKRKKIGRLFKEIVMALNKYPFGEMVRYIIARISLRSIKVENLLGHKFVKSNNKKSQQPIDSLHSHLIYDTTQKRIPMHLRVGDRVTSAFSLESRFPFLDHRLIEFSLSQPPTFDISNGSTKYILRKAIQGLIPESVLSRRKMATPIPLGTWLTVFKQEIIMTFNSERFRRRGYFNQSVILDIFKRYCDGKMNGLEKKFYGEIIWRILNVELWLETFFDTEHFQIISTSVENL
ncbi:MAG: asparagine synthase, partial [Clostridiales bacterium]|nr:asparagine synthase [Clostridiales bacterium]